MKRSSSEGRKGRAARLVVGDTPRDIDAAHATGAIAVGVATGKFTVDELREAGADHVLSTLEEPLPDLPDLAGPSEADRRRHQEGPVVMADLPLARAQTPTD